MKTPHDTQLINAADWTRLNDSARHRAQALRREAIDDVWRGADAAFQATLASANRSAQRLAHRLVRHVRGRSAQADSPSIHPEGV